MTRSVEIKERQTGEPLPSREWWTAWRAAVGDDLLGGYGRLIKHTDDERRAILLRPARVLPPIERQPDAPTT